MKEKGELAAKVFCYARIKQWFDLHPEHARRWDDMTPDERKTVYKLLAERFYETVIEGKYANVKDFNTENGVGIVFSTLSEKITQMINKSEFINYVITDCNTFLTDSDQIRMFQPAIMTIDTSYPNSICGACLVNDTNNINVECFEKNTGVTKASTTILTTLNTGSYGYADRVKSNLFSANFRKVTASDTTANELYVAGYVLNSDLDIITKQLINTLDYIISISDIPNVNYEQDLYIAINHLNGVTFFGTDNFNVPPVKEAFTTNPVNPICINETGNYILTWTEANIHKTKYRYRCDAANQEFTNYTSLTNDYEANIWCSYNRTGLFDIEFNVLDEFNLSFNHSFTVNTKAGVFPVCNIFCSTCDSTETFIVEEEEAPPDIEGQSPELGPFIRQGLEVMGVRTNTSRVFFYMVVAIALIFMIGTGHEVFKEYTGALVIIAELIWMIYAAMPVATGGLAFIPAWIPILLVPVIGIIGLFYYNKFFDNFNQASK